MQKEQDWRRKLEKHKFKWQAEKEGERASPEAGDKQGGGESQGKKAVNHAVLGKDVR